MDVLSVMATFAEELLAVASDTNADCTASPARSCAGRGCRIRPALDVTPRRTRLTCKLHRQGVAGEKICLTLILLA